MDMEFYILRLSLSLYGRHQLLIGSSDAESSISVFSTDCMIAPPNSPSLQYTVEAHVLNSLITITDPLLLVLQLN